MNLLCRISLQLLLVGLLAICTNAQTQSTLQGKVVAITDGDTITILDHAAREHHIRLYGIDSPETRQEFGEQARLSLAKIVFGRHVNVEYSKQDYIGRIRGKVSLLSGEDVSLKQIKAGMAWHDRESELDQTTADRKTYARAEQKARADRNGLWASANPTPPWQWRGNEVAR